MNFNEFIINRTDDCFCLKYLNQKVWLIKTTFEHNRIRYNISQENATNDFIKCILNNLHKIEIELDPQSKKYFIDAEDEEQLEHIFDELGFHLHQNFSRLYFKSYREFV